MRDIGQAAALRSIFAAVYSAAAPRRLLVLGCTTGQDFLHVDTGVTTTLVGVDINGEYLATARATLEQIGHSVQLVEGDVTTFDCELPQFDLVHAALIFEYVDPEKLFRRIASWLAPDGVCSVVSQDPANGLADVTPTGYKSLQLLEGTMNVVTSDRLEIHARSAGLVRTMIECHPLKSGKSFSLSLFQRA